MRLLPPSTNDAYTGSRFSIAVLLVFAAITVVPGLIHEFAADGGAGTIAGIDLSQGGRVIIAVFAWAGATQIVFGLAALACAWRYQNLVPLMLALALLERTLHALNAWVLKSAGITHHPPEHYGVLVGLPILAIALVLSLRDRATARATSSR